MRLTKHRQEVLATLKTSSEALSAAQIHSHLPHINLVTIYRALEYFTQEGLTKRLYLNDQEAQYELADEPHHHAVCDDCDRVIHFTVDESALLKYFSFKDFAISDIDITVHGRCQKKHLHQ
jgi:Fe2+ or Zn2+ uptake regulation protein